MKILMSIALGVMVASSGALAQTSTNGTPTAVPGQGPGGSGAQSSSGSASTSQGAAGQQSQPGSLTADPNSPTNTTGQPAGDKPAQ